MNDVPVSPMKEGVIASLVLVMWSVEGRAVNATSLKHKFGTFFRKVDYQRAALLTKPPIVKFREVPLTALLEG